MPSPRPHPHTDEINSNTWHEPDVVCLFYSAPKFVKMKAAQREPDEYEC
jgi:hypothetical protein